MDQKKIRDYVENQIRPLELKELKIKHLGKGSCTLEVEVTDKQLNYLGIVHGGIIFAICDSCAGVTANTLTNSAVTLNASMNFIRSVKTGTIRATSSTIHSGKSTSVVRVEAYDNKGSLLADGTFTMYNITKA